MFLSHAIYNIIIVFEVKTDQNDGEILPRIICCIIASLDWSERMKERGEKDNNYFIVRLCKTYTNFKGDLSA